MKATTIIQVSFLCILAHSLYAQLNNIAISCKVTDIHEKPLEGAAIVLRSVIDSAYITGTVTDTSGIFALSITKAQEYLLEFSMLGYKKRNIYALLSKSQRLPSIVMEEDAQQLSAVTVTGKRIFMQMKPGTTTFNMEVRVLGSQGNILDALRSLPGVMVNEDGSVILNGQTGIQVLVNGKSTNLSGDKLVNYLRSMPVSAIKDIELITSPSAKYDASGKTGLIEIRTRKVMAEGWTFQANGGYQQSYDGKWNAVTFQIQIQNRHKIDLGRYL